MLGFGIRESTTTTGTGDITVAAVTGYPRFSDVFNATDQRRFYYSVTDADGKPLEHGIGYLSATSTLVRETILATYVSSTYDNIAPTAVSLASGTKYLICSVPVSAAPLFTPFTNSTFSKKIGAFTSGSEQNIGAVAQGANMFQPMLVPYDCECTGMSMYISIAAAAGKFFRMGLYDTNASGQPRRVLFDSGAIAADSTGVKTYALGTNIRLQAGLYWAVWCSDGTPSFTGVGGYSFPGICGRTTGDYLRSAISMYLSGSSYGAFSDSPTANSLIAYSSEASPKTYYITLNLA